MQLGLLSMFYEMLPVPFLQASVRGGVESLDVELHTDSRAHVDY